MSSNIQHNATAICMFLCMEAVVGRTWPGSRQVYAKGGAYTKITTSKMDKTLTGEIPLKPIYL